MIERLDEPAGVVGVKVSGRLNHEDFRKLREWIGDATVGSHDCNVIVVFDQFHGWTAYALWDDLKFHTIHCRNVDRLAYVGHKGWHKLLVNLSGPVTAAKVRYFDATSLDAAKTWVENG